ncbi:hypothetical protein C8Q78DRAFT_1052854 [Trametes maxima]|nr:hypothetical protein C8Q78DRAFT_1052854 [Trametes maxima]
MQCIVFWMFLLVVCKLSANQEKSDSGLSSENHKEGSLGVAVDKDPDISKGADARENHIWGSRLNPWWPVTSRRGS